VGRLVAATVRRPAAGLERVRWAMLLAALVLGLFSVLLGLYEGSRSGAAGVVAVLLWMGLLLLGYHQPQRQGVAFDVAELCLLAVFASTIGIEQGVGVFYCAVFVRAVYADRVRLTVSVVAYLAAMLVGFAVQGDLSSAGQQLPMHAFGLTFTALPLSVVVGSLLTWGRELVSQRQLLEAVLDSLDVAVVAADDQGREVLANAAAQAAGLSAPLLLVGEEGGRRVRTSSGAATLPAEQLPLRRATTGPVRDQELSLDLPDGRGRVDYLVHARATRADEDAAPIVVAALHDVTARRRAEERLQRQALHDALTGLPNRLLLRDRLQHALSRVTRRGAPPALLVLDLDGFKGVNDSAGHDVGDRVLLTIADRLGRCLRPQDTLARLGGDEFAVLLEETGEGEAVDVAGRLVAAASEPVDVDRVSFCIGASVGVTAPRAAEVQAGLVDDGDLLRNADLAMYAAKAAGKGRVEVYAAQMHESLLARVTLERDLRAALDRDELRLHYQPVVALGSGDTTGVEALIRWQSPTRGLVMPGDFISVAETSGLVVPLGAWVLRTACEQAAAWRRSGDPALADLHVAVNVSVVQLNTPDLAQTVRQALDDSGLPPDRLVLEITESAFSDIESTLPRLHALRALGVQMAIDDFGTGYSSLTRLQMFPVDTVKIDRSFVSTITSERTAPLVTATLALARAFGMSTVAEGVEDQVQEEYLREHGCDLAQGYLFSRPVPAAEIVQRLQPALPRVGAGS